jgi:hypothetical protein
MKNNMKVQTNLITVEAVLDRIEEHYADLRRLYRRVPVTQLVEPDLPNGWSVKDLVTHLAAWEWRCALLLEQLDGPSNAPLQAEPDVEALNQEVFEERKSWGWDEVEDDARAAHRALVKAIRQLSSEQCNDPIVYETIAADTWEHYGAHLADLRSWHRAVQTE